MNSADVAQSALPLTSSDLSIFTLFWQAHRSSQVQRVIPSGSRRVNPRLSVTTASVVLVALTNACAAALRWPKAGTLSKLASAATLLAAAALSWLERASAAAWHVGVSTGRMDPVLVGGSHVP